jgi:hypothetical protein
MGMTFRTKCIDKRPCGSLERTDVGLRPMDHGEESPGMGTLIFLADVHHEIFFEGEQYLVVITPIVAAKPTTKGDQDHASGNL